MSAVSRGPAGHHPQQQRHSSSLLACVRESSPPSDPELSPAAADAALKNGSAAGAEPKKRRFHPLRGLRRMFRRSPRTPEPAASAEAGGGGGDQLAVPEVHLRSRSASELMDSTQELRKRSGGALSSSSNGGSTGVLSGGLSLSHDSIFTSDSRGGSSSPRVGSALDIPESMGRTLSGGISPPIGVNPNIACHAGVRAELFEAVRRRRGRSRSDDDEEEDLGLPSSPYGVSPSTTADEHNNMGAHSTCSDGSLLSMGSNDMDEDLPPSTTSSQFFFGHSDDMVESESGDKIPPLSHFAAKHKIAVKPKRTHGPPRLRRLHTTTSVLPSTPEAAEEIIPAVDTSTDEVCLPAALPDTNPAALPSPVEKPTSPLPTGAAPSFEAILERQLKSASLPPGLAPPPATTTTTAPADVKLSRSHSNTEQPSLEQIKPAYRRAVSAVRIEQAALASAAVSKFSAMFGDEKPQEKPPVPLPRTAPVKKPEELLASPAKEIKSILKKEPDSPTKKEAPRLAPKPEPRRISMASARQRVEPVLKTPDAPLPPPPTSPASVSPTSNFVLVAYTDDSLDTNKGFESPSSLDSLEDFRRVRSPHSQLDSLERNLKMSSDSLSSGTELSSTSEELRPTLKYRQSWVSPEPSPEIEVRPVKLRVIKSRHSDPPVETPPPELLIRKSSSVDSIISENNNTNCRKSSSNDSLSSSEEVNLRPSEIRKRLNDKEWHVRTEKTNSNTTPEFLRLQLHPVDNKQDQDTKSSSEDLDNKPKLSKTTPSPQRTRLYSNPASMDIKVIEKEEAPKENNYSPYLNGKEEPRSLIMKPKIVEEAKPVLPKVKTIVEEVKLAPPKVKSTLEEVKLVAPKLKSPLDEVKLFTPKVKTTIEEVKPKVKIAEEVKVIVPKVEEQTPMQILPSKLKLCEEPKPQNGVQRPIDDSKKSEVVLRRKSVLPEAKTEECELFKVFARRSLKLTKDADNNWEAIGLQKSRDSDKENDDELTTKPAASNIEKNLNSINNNVAPPSSTVANNNSLNRLIRTAEQKTPEKLPRPMSFSDKIKWSMKDKEIELVKSESSSGTASLPPAVSSDIATIKTLTPKVRKKLDQWERWAQQGGNPQP